MSNNATSAGAGTVTTYVLMIVDKIPFEGAAEVLFYGILGGIGGIIGKHISTFLIKKTIQFFTKLKNKKSESK